MKISNGTVAVFVENADYSKGAFLGIAEMTKVSEGALANVRDKTGRVMASECPSGGFVCSNHDYPCTWVKLEYVVLYTTEELLQLVPHL